jgi:hypothetical protein
VIDAGQDSSRLLPDCQILLQIVAVVSYHYQPKGQRRLRMGDLAKHIFPHLATKRRAAMPLLSFFAAKLHSSQEAAGNSTGEDRSCAGWQSAFWWLANYSWLAA